jgi:hypothetical protein
MSELAAQVELRLCKRDVVTARSVTSGWDAGVAEAPFCGVLKQADLMKKDQDNRYRSYEADQE